MRVDYILFFTVMIVCDSIGISSCATPKTMDLLANFGKCNDDAPNEGDSDAGPSSSSDREHPFFKLLGYGLDQLEFIRLISYKNPQRQFEFRRYTFPVNIPVELLRGLNQYVPIPNREQIVMSTSDGNVFAILDSTDVLGGIYAHNPRHYSKGRAKFNMRSGEVTLLTTDEVRETPVGRKRQFDYGYRVEHLNHSHGSSSSSRRSALPNRLPSPDGFGYDLDQMEFIRLIPKKNANRLFELRRYTFPAEKLILSLNGGHNYRPIPVEERIVLSTLEGEIFAILGDVNDLAGMYKYTARTHAKKRVKLNLRSGSVIPMTSDEVDEVPVGSHRTILLNFRILHLNRDPPRNLFD